MKTKTSLNQETPPAAKPLLAAGVFSRLGKNQKEIINKIVIDDYYILKTLDTRDMSVTISLVDDAGNHDRDLTENELKALFDRGFLLNADVSRCLQLEQEKFWLDEQYAEAAMNVLQLHLQCEERALRVAAVSRM